ncbi:hypothetical protein AgCh_025076 [Apium graveolens]
MSASKVFAGAAVLTTYFSVPAVPVAQAIDSAAIESALFSRSVSESVDTSAAIEVLKEKKKKDMLMKSFQTETKTRMNNLKKAMPNPREEEDYEEGSRVAKLQVKGRYPEPLRSGTICFDWALQADMLTCGDEMESYKNVESRGTARG